MKRRAAVLAGTVAVVALACTPRAPAPAAPPPVRSPYSVEALFAVASIEELVLRPDGRELAFTSDATGAYELWTLALDDGGLAAGEPRPRTRAHEHVTGVTYGPDGAVAFTQDHGGDERPDLWILRAGEDAAEPLTRTPKVAERAPRFTADGRALVFECDPDEAFRFDVCALDLATRKTTRLTHEAVNVVSPIALDDGRVVATRTPDDQRGELLVVPRGGGAAAVLPASRAGGIAFAQAAEDGRVLATALADDGFMRAAWIDVSSGAAGFFGPRGVDVEHVLRAGRGFVLDLNDHGGSTIVSSAGEGDAGHAVSSGGYVAALDTGARGRLVAYAYESGEQPPEILTWPVSGGVATVVVPAMGQGAIDPRELPRTEVRTFRAKDGLAIDAYVTRPPVLRLGDPPPAIVHVHGGPDSQVRPWFDPMVDALAEAGFVVVRPNYRGSAGYGRTFRDANNRDWGGGDLDDVVTVVQALAHEGAIDGSRLGITGGSYGGYLTLRAITKRPEMWRAAVERYGMADLAEDFRLGEAGYREWYRTEMGDPATDAALYRDRSPMFALDRVRAPLLVIQGANDVNVPRAESDAVVAALRARGRTVEYVVYPDEGHELTKRANRIDAAKRTVDFFLHEMAPDRR